MAIELVPLCNVKAQLKPPIEVGPAVFSSRMIFEVASIQLEGDRLRGAMEGVASADWLLVGQAGEASLDVRATVRTHDGAIVYASYYGRCTFTGDFPVTVYVAPASRPPTSATAGSTTCRLSAKGLSMRRSASTTSGTR